MYPRLSQTKGNVSNMAKFVLLIVIFILMMVIAALALYLKWSEQPPEEVPFDTPKDVTAGNIIRSLLISWIRNHIAMESSTPLVKALLLQHVEENRATTILASNQALVQQHKKELVGYSKWLTDVISNPNRDWGETFDEAFWRFGAIMHDKDLYNLWRHHFSCGFTIGSEPHHYFCDDEFTPREFIPEKGEINPAHFTPTQVQDLYSDPWYHQNEQFAYESYQQLIRIKSSIDKLLAL